MKSKINMKKIIKTINDNCKKLNYDGYYILDKSNKEIISVSGENDKETPGIHRVKFKDENYIALSYDYIFNKKNRIINGKSLGSVLGGTGCIVNEDLITSIKKETVDGEKIENKKEWYKGKDIPKNKLDEMMLLFNRYKYNISKLNITSSTNLDIDYLLNQGQFCEDISNKLDINSYLLITNKMIKNFNKDTISIKVSVTDFLVDEELNQTNIRFCIIQSESEVCTITSYYAFIDLIK